MSNSMRLRPANPLLDQIREVRRRMAKACHYDMHEFGRLIREAEGKFAHDPRLDKQSHAKGNSSTRAVGTKRSPVPPNPVVDQVREARRKLAAECGYDLNRLVAKLRASEAASGRRPVSLRKKKTYTA